MMQAAVQFSLWLDGGLPVGAWRQILSDAFQYADIPLMTADCMSFAGWISESSLRIAEVQAGTCKGTSGGASLTAYHSGQPQWFAAARDF